jgi:lysine 6-dehydrogenase
LHIDGRNIAPRTLTSELLRRQWQLQPGEKEFTVMRVIVNGGEQHIVYDLYDEYDDATQVSSMARTTGYACSAAANLIVSGQYTRPGISPPEYVGKNAACFDFILEYLRQRSVYYQKTTQ